MVATNTRSWASGAGGAAGARFDCSTTTHPPIATRWNSLRSARTSALMSSLKGASTKTQVERLVRSPELAQRAMHIGRDDAGAIDKFQLRKIGANRGGPHRAKNPRTSHARRRARAIRFPSDPLPAKKCPGTRAPSKSIRTASREKIDSRAPRRGRPGEQSARRPLAAGREPCPANNSHRVSLFEA